LGKLFYPVYFKLEPGNLGFSFVINRFYLLFPGKDGFAARGAIVKLFYYINNHILYGLSIYMPRDYTKPSAQRAKLEALRSVPVMAVAVNDPLGVVICESGDECYTLRDITALYERVKGIEASKVGVPIRAAGSTPMASTPASTAPMLPIGTEVQGGDA
jgi:hypothetical protein